MRLTDPDVPIVIATGVSVFRTGIDAMKLGASDYVVKPFREEDILTAVHGALLRPRSQQNGPSRVNGRGASSDTHRIVALVGRDVPSRAILAVLLREVAPVACFPYPTEALPYEQVASAVIFLGSASPTAHNVVLDFRRAAPAAGLFVVAHSPEVLDHRRLTCRTDGFFGVEQLGALINAVRARCGSRQRQVTMHVGRALAYIADHYSSRPINVGAVAEAIGISESHLAHLFPEETGMTFRQFLSILRVEVARELLASSDEKVDAIARRVGFSGASYLSRALCRYTGQPPTAHR